LKRHGEGDFKGRRIGIAATGAGFSACHLGRP
jgi:hypothetical protein